MRPIIYRLREKVETLGISRSALLYYSIILLGIMLWVLPITLGLADPDPPPLPPPGGG